MGNQNKIITRKISALLFGKCPTFLHIATSLASLDHKTTVTAGAYFSGDITMFWHSESHSSRISNPTLPFPLPSALSTSSSCCRFFLEIPFPVLSFQLWFLLLHCLAVLDLYYCFSLSTSFCLPPQTHSASWSQAAHSTHYLHCLLSMSWSWRECLHQTQN